MTVVLLLRRVEQTYKLSLSFLSTQHFFLYEFLGICVHQQRSHIIFLPPQSGQVFESARAEKLTS